jgi:hypothetical protein
VLACLVVCAVTPTAHTARVERCIWLQSLARAHEVICFHDGLCVVVCVCVCMG